MLSYLNKIRKVRLFAIAVFLFSFVFITPEAEAVKKRSKKPGVWARSAILSDITNGKRLYGKNVNQRVVPASTAKVMTALLVLERLPLEKYVTVSSKAASAAPSKINVHPGERYRVADLLKAILMNSANDASIVLAEAVSGSERAFVNLMNSRARELGCKNTKFLNSHGLPTDAAQYTSAYDMLLIFRQALKHAFFKEVLTHRNRVIYSQAGRKVFLKSHNKILWFNWKNKAYGKTGYTRKAKACFVGYVHKGKNTYIVGVFGCRTGQRWNSIKYILRKYGGLAL